MKDICAIIPMYGFPDTTRNCVDHLLKNADVDLDILVVDDGSPEPFKDDRVYTLRLDKNRGYTGANNAGMLWAMQYKYKYLLLLNNDTEALPGLIQPLLDAFTKDPKVGVAGASRIIYDEKGEEYIENFGIDLISGYQAYSKFDIDKELVYVVWIPTCATIIPTEVVQNVGLFDRRMKIYCSDNDFCVRAHALGYRVVLVPQSKVRHFHMTTTRANKCDAAPDQIILLEKLSCNLQRQLCETYPLDWHEKSWGKLEFKVYKKEENPVGHCGVEVKDGELDGELNQPATA